MGTEAQCRRLGQGQIEVCENRSSADEREEMNLPSTTVANNLDIHVIAGLVLVEGLDELLVHPRVELAHPTCR